VYCTILADIPWNESEFNNENSLQERAHFWFCNVLARWLRAIIYL